MSETTTVDSETNPLRESVERNYEMLKLLLYFVGILVLAMPLSQMLGGAWQRADLARAIVRLPLNAGIAFEDLTVLLFGVYLGLLALMTADAKKRWQGFLLWIGTAVALVGLQSMDLFLPNIDLVASGVWLVGGFGVGAIVTGGRTLGEFASDTSTEIVEFRRAARALYAMTVLIVVAAFLEYHVVYPELFFAGPDAAYVRTVDQFYVGFDFEQIGPHLVVSTLFIVVMRGFVKYDAQKNFFVLGPKGSGKSLFLIGAYLTALERVRNEEQQTPLRPSEDLMSIVEEMDQDESGWAVRGTAPGTVHELSFQYVYGSVFPTNVTVTSFDYAGEYLHELPDTLESGSGIGGSDDEDIGETLQRLKAGVQAADILLLVIDIERFVNEEPLEISEYFSILKEADDTRTVLIGTKADYLIEDFDRETGLEAHRNYDEFRRYTRSRLKENTQIDSLLQEASESDVYPVYYQTRVNDAGERVPMRDGNGRVMTVGYDGILDNLARW